MSEMIDESISGTTGVEQVTDTTPGQLEEINGEKIINSIEDLVAFAWDVTNGNNYEDQTVKLGLSLDFNSSKSYIDPYRTDFKKYGYNGELKTLLTSGEGFKSIGVTTNQDDRQSKSFNGTFDGNGKVIKNLYICRENIEDNKLDLRIGLFGNNYGEIKKLGIENCNISGELTSSGANTIMVGGIASVSYGKIDNCFVSGEISSKANNTAKNSTSGIAASAAIVQNCYNLAKITGIGDNSTNWVGGICSSSQGSEIVVNNCYNMGEVVAIKGNANYVSGIKGYCGRNSNLSISHCYNLGNITLSELTGYIFCGGIVGDRYWI